MIDLRIQLYQGFKHRQAKVKKGAMNLQNKVNKEEVNPGQGIKSIWWRIFTVVIKQI